MRAFLLRHPLDPLIAVDAVENVEELALVLVDALHHHVEQERLRNADPLRLLDVHGQSLLRLQMRRLPRLLDLGVGRVVAKQGKQTQIRHPLVCLNRVCDELRQNYK